VTNSKILRMRESARQMRRAAEMAHDPRMIGMLLKMANEADADADQYQAELERIQELPPQT